jgi:hypothetical protein
MTAFLILLLLAGLGLLAIGPKLLRAREERRRIAERIAQVNSRYGW